MAPENSVPFVDLRYQTLQVQGEIEASWRSIVHDSKFVFGPQVDLFEERLASYYGVTSCISVANGTDALEIALRALGIGVGDEVIVPALTFVATAAAVLRAGATPVFADINPATYLLDPESTSFHLTSRTAAIIPVHLYGQMADMEAIAAIASRHGLALIEDGAQSHGATQRGSKSGLTTDAITTSFYPGKNLGAWGDGGAILTNSYEVSHAVRAIRNFGGIEKHDHNSFGINSRLDTVQAAVLLAKLAHLDTWNESRLQAAHRYAQLLSDTDIILPRTSADNNHVWHLFVVRTSDRVSMGEFLSRHGIETGIHYPQPLHRLGMFVGADACSGDLIHADLACSTMLSLPLFPGITDSQLHYVCEVIAKYASQ